MIEPLREIDDVINNTPRTKHGSAQSLRIQDILRPIHGKVNELADAVNDLQAMVYEGPDDFMEDLDDEDDCCACDDDNRAWKETDPFVERLHHLSTSQLEHLLEEAEWILEGRHRQDQTGLCPECQAQAEAEDEDGYDGCCHCNCDCHDLPDDDDEEITWEVQQIVDKVRRERKESAQRLEDGLRDIKEGRGTSKKGSDPKSVDTSDGLFSQFAGYVVKHPELRFYQALTNWSGYKKILGEDDGEDRYDLFHETTKGPNR